MSITSQIKALGSPCCLDMETALAPLCFEGRGQVRLLQFYSEKGECWFDLQTFTDADWEELKQVLEHPATTWIAQNFLFDYRCLLGCGIRLQGRLEDTLIQSALLTNGLANTSNSLEAIAMRVLKLKLDKSLQAQDWMSADLAEADLDYAMNDVRITYRCWEEMRAQIKTARLQRVYDLECSLIPAVVEMEHTGMLVDQEQAMAAIAQLEEEITESRGEFLDLLDQRLRSAADAA